MYLLKHKICNFGPTLGPLKSGVGSSFLVFAFIFILYRQQVYRNPITDGVGTIKTTNNHSIHAERSKARPVSYGNFHTELIKMDAHFLNLHQLPKKSALGILVHSELAWRRKRKKTFRF